MSFRARVTAALLVGALLPMTALALLVRHEMTARLTAQYERRVDAIVAGIATRLARESDAVGAALSQVRAALSSDNRFRRAAVDGVETERRYLLDYAGDAMRLAGLDLLQIQDETGRVVSSGHFRNDYDRVDAVLPRRLASSPGGIALVRARTPTASLLALAGIDSVSIGSRRFRLVGGIEAKDRLMEELSRDEALRVSLVLPGDSLAGGDESSALLAPEAIVRELRVPFVDPGQPGPETAVLRVSHDLDEMQALRRSVDRWFIVAVAVTAALAALVAGRVSSRVSRPVVELAEKAARIDLDRLDVDFPTGRRDEIGVLSRGLAAMTTRLRESTARLKDAERRAAIGDLARQVNHDLRNGLTPIRNVLRHLTQQVQDDPARLPDVFRERQGTFQSSISYLDELAGHYARLAQRGEPVRCDLNEVVGRVAAGMQGTSGVDLRADLCKDAVVFADPISLRRIVENLQDNAIDSLAGRGGHVTVSTERVRSDSGETRVRLSVSDTGVGMNDIQRTRIFDDFYTTKPAGSGLGLSIVRRLVMDLDGTIQVVSEEGRGSRFIVEFPAAGEGAA
jgi:signal transduction histidine kinase